MATWWRVWRGELKPVEVDGSTADSVWIEGGMRQRIDRGWESYYPTWEEAHACALAEAEQELESARTNLDRALERLTIVANMKKPEGA